MWSGSSWISPACRATGANERPRDRGTRRAACVRPAQRPAAAGHPRTARSVRACPPRHHSSHHRRRMVDGRAASRSRRDLRRARARTSAGAAELPMQYADYTLWQEKRLNADALRAVAAVTGASGWRAPKPRAARGCPRERTTDMARRARVLHARRARSARDRRARPPYERDALHGAARRSSTCCCIATAARTTSLSGRPCAGRHVPETEALIGFFLNTICLRTDLAGNPASAEVLARVREATVSALAHQDVPFDMVVEALAPDRTLSRRLCST